MKTLLLNCILFICSLTGKFSYASTVVPLEINDGGYIFLSVTINGNVNARFMLDTGAGVNVISERLFEKIKSSLKEYGLHTGTRHNGEQITGMLYRMDELSIAGFSGENVVVGIYNGLNEVDGLLSLDYFRDTPFTIDFLNKVLIIEDKANLMKLRRNGISIPITIQTKGKNEIAFFVDICLDNNVRCSAEFDTGAGFNMLMLHPRYIDQLDLKVPTEPVNFGYYVFSTTLPRLMYCASTTKLQSSNVFAGFKEGLIFDALIGSGMFRLQRLTINLPASEMIAH